MLTAFFMAVNANAQIPKAEHDALLDLYQVVNEPDWFISLDLKQSPDSWHRVFFTNNRVPGINLSRNNLKGTLPISIGNLTNLYFPELVFNQLEGELPQSLSQVQHKRSLVLNSNPYDRKIPSYIDDSKKLEVLLLSSIHFTGTVSKDILNVFDKCFRDSFSSAVLHLKEFQKLNIAANNFTDKLPNDLTEISGLRPLLIFDNNFHNQNKFNNS